MTEQLDLKVIRKYVDQMAPGPWTAAHRGSLLAFLAFLDLAEWQQAEIERLQSVRNALEAIVDAVGPLPTWYSMVPVVSVEHIRRAIEALKETA